MNHLAWYVARAAGLVAWTLLTASVVWGLSITTKVLRGRPRPAWLLDMHRYLGGLAVIFTGVHIAGIVADSYVHFDAMSVLIPFASRWRPGAVAWGVAGLYMLLAVELTSLARARLPKKLWRATHVASFPLFAFATVHAMTAGTDAKTWLVQGLAALFVIAVVGLTAYRVSGARSATAPRAQMPVTPDRAAQRTTSRAPVRRPVGAGSR
ncbi:MAG: ferric reductase-like transmembrane domain-containing protein [Actinomycetota bacterium]